MMTSEVADQDSRNNNCDMDSENNKMDAMATLLQSSIQGVQNSFSSVYATLAANLKQSLEMTHAMNSVMEQFLLSNIRITTNITQIRKSETQGGNFIPSLLTITITNSGQFPIPHVSCSLTFEKKSDNELVNIDMKCNESVKRDTMRPDSESSPTPSIFVQETCNVSATHPTSISTFTLSPQTQIIEKLRLAPSEFSQYNAKVTVRFASPGTGKLLQKEHPFGLYLIDQCEKHLSFTSRLTDIAKYNYATVELSPYLLRQLWNVHPSSGLSETMAFEICLKVRNLFDLVFS
ncbi:hypothetical protein C1645_747772 [Glomus cerebriforme]|uniref:Uncharacterized protein n=1 Tax=Glomus cerebriforme TaxID=658196 RepID=A0A397TLZ8_9GLOM|nr:hypothetical protein C1645_747772 [Glomus cerebriforme]